MVGSIIDKLDNNIAIKRIYEGLIEGKSIKELIKDDNKTNKR